MDALETRQWKDKQVLIYAYGGNHEPAEPCDPGKGEYEAMIGRSV